MQPLQPALFLDNRIFLHCSPGWAAFRLSLHHSGLLPTPRLVVDRPHQPMHDPRAALLQHNRGNWQGCFIRLGGSGREEDRFPTSLQVQEREGVIENCLTYLATGQQRTMNFENVPFTMQVSSSGGWSLGPSAITPLAWVGELSVVHGDERRRVVARHGFHGLDQVVYIVETKAEREPITPPPPLQCSTRESGPWVIWQPEPNVELLLDARDRQMGDATACGLRWTNSNGQVHQIVRRYDANGYLENLSETDIWP